MTKSNPLVSIIIPFFNEEENLVWHHKKMSQFLQSSNIKHEFIYINDGSTDSSLSIVKSLIDSDGSVRYLSFSRNFGKEAATTAGIHAAKGDAAVIIDADGQHPIELVDTFIQEWRAGFQTIIGVRESNQGEGPIKSIGSKLFYFLLRLLGADNSAQSGLTDFRLIDRKIINEYKKLTEHNRITRNLLDWLGYRRKLVPFHANERHAGKASYSFRKLLKLAIDGIVKHSTRPLKFIGIIGALISLLSGALGLFFIIEVYVLADPMRLGITGSGILAVFLSFMVGVVLFCQGLLALYLENVYYETQNRPIYIVDEES